MAEYPYNLIENIFGRGYVQRNVPDLIASVEYVIATLEPREQLIIRLHYCEELSVVQVADEIERSKQTVYNVLHKALRKLRHPSRANYIRYGVSGVFTQQAYRMKCKAGCKPRRLPIEATTISGELFNTLKDANIRTVQQVVKLGSDYFKHQVKMNYEELVELYHMLVRREFIEEAEQR